MLTILFIQMRWYKEDRKPQSSVLRRKFFNPAVLNDFPEVPEGDCVFIKTLNYTQRGNQISEGKTFANDIALNGCVLLKDLELPNIEITHENDKYRVSWFDSGQGNVRRRGGNKDFGIKGRRLAGCPNTLNETAFILDKGEAGIIRWNNRFSSYRGQWYEQYQAYFVNTNNLNKRVFIREYNHEYQQLADLF